MRWPCCLGVCISVFLYVYPLLTYVWLAETIFMVIAMYIAVSESIPTASLIRNFTIKFPNRNREQPHKKD
jgi:hypothetical protein